MKDRVKTTFDVTPVWRQVSPELKGELVEFWQRNRAIGDRQRAERRADQAICVARNETGDVCGVATAVLRVFPLLRQPLYYYRTFLDKSVRGQGRVLPFYDRCRQVLEAYNAGLEAPESLGVLSEMENRHLTGPDMRQAWLKDVNGVFIGYSMRGLLQRVTYFEGASLMKLEQVLEMVRQGRAELPANATSTIPMGGKARGHDGE